MAHAVTSSNGRTGHWVAGRTAGTHRVQLVPPIRGAFLHKDANQQHRGSSSSMAVSARATAAVHHLEPRVTSKGKVDNACSTCSNQLAASLAFQQTIHHGVAIQQVQAVGLQLGAWHAVQAPPRALYSSLEPGGPSFSTKSQPASTHTHMRPRQLPYYQAGEAHLWGRL